jgi:hypothetical protein|tara:strand:- start:43 stop:372 length:330 start_codon:yes stop_codon:yes gene_type:complete
VPEDATRGSTLEGDEKARFTTLESGNGDGGMLPSMHVIKCTVKKGESDFSRTRVWSTICPEYVASLRQMDGSWGLGRSQWRFRRKLRERRGLSSSNSYAHTSSMRPNVT